MPVQSSHCEPDQMVLLVEDRLSSDEIARMEQHLEQCGSCRDSFDRLVGDRRWLKAVRRHLGDEPGEPAEAGAQATETLEFLAPSDWPDSLGRLGAYEIKGYLGRGGMGVVLKAFDPVLRRNVAVKVLSAALASSGTARQRFLREARAAAAVVHPHVVGVYAVVESAGQPFLVMEYVPGRSLQERLDKHGPLTLAEILRIGMQTADGLSAAHAQGLVHRDVKPANILLEDDVERVRLTDFGLARAAAEAAFTRSGVVAGTPHYMAPEQALGQAADQRADLFSLGSTLYAACAGHPPFRADSPLAVLKRVCEEEARPLLEINSDIPSWLQAIVARLMHKDPAQRFQTAAEVSDLLRRCLAHVQQPSVVQLPAEAAHAEQRRPTRRLRRRAAFTALAALLVGACALIWWNPGRMHGINNQTTKQDMAFEQPGRANDWSLGADNITGQIQNAQRQATDLESSLIHTDSGEHDLLSEMIQQLRQRTMALEREVAPSLPVTTERPAYRSSLIPNERK